MFLRLKTTAVLAGCAALALAACSPAETVDEGDYTEAEVDAINAGIALQGDVTPESVRAMIEADGAQETVATLYNGGEGAAWNVVEQGIYQGEQAWLEIYPLLQPGLENATAMSMNVNLAQALLTNPAGVLGAYPGAAENCVNADADYMEDPAQAAASNATYYPQAIAAVEGITDPALAAQKAECLTNLRAGQTRASAAG